MGDWSSFIIHEWQWALTWGWYQLALGVFCSIGIFMSMRRAKSLPALILVVISYWSTFVVYLIFMLLLSVYMIKIAQVPVNIIANGAVILCSGMLFSFLQAFFLHITHQLYRVKLQCALGVTLAGNSVATIITFIAAYAMRSNYMHELIASLQQSII